MAASDGFITYVKEIFAPFGGISVRRMFGGAGVYCDGRMFAIIGDDDIWLKVDDENRSAFAAAGLAQFTYDMKDGSSAKMGYHAAPEEIFDDEDELKRWTALAPEAADRAAARKARKGVKKGAKKGSKAARKGKPTAKR